MNNDDRIEDNEYFVSMIQLAMEEDDDIADVIKAIVSKDKNDRIRIIDEITGRFRKNEVVPEIVDALEYLKDDQVAAKIRSLI